MQIANASRMRTNLKAAIAKRLGVILAELWKISGVTVEQAILRFQTDPRIEFIEPNYIVYANETTPGDPEFEDLWGMHNTGQTGGKIDADIDAPEAWDTQTDCRNLVVGVIDTGGDYNHPDLQPNIWTSPGEIAGNGEDDDGNGFIDDVHGWDFVNNDNNPMDDHFHGTHVSGSIAAAGNNDRGVIGVCWGGQIMALKFLDNGGSGTTADAIEAIEYATMMKRDFGVNIRLTNNSWGGGGYSQALYIAIRASQEADMLFVAAAGNSSSNNDRQPHYPSSFDLDGIIAVAATDHNDNLSSLSNYGQTSVDLGAPGLSILSTITGGNYAYLNGTSMATPHVSGVIVLAWSLNLQISNLEIKNTILNAVDPVDSLRGITVTGGRVNAYKAVNAVSDETPSNEVFEDVPPGYWAEDFIYTLFDAGITVGCSQVPLMYCPENSVTRVEMAVFLLRTKYGSDYQPPTAVGIFDDLPTSHWAADWIEQLYSEGITGGCSQIPFLYCPEYPVTRAEMAVFIVRTFNL